MRPSLRHSLRRPPARGGFTLTELLVVIVLIMLLAVAAVPAALSLLAGRQLNEASGTVQAFLAGARDRALAADQPRGVRLVVDDQDPSIVRTLQYIRPQVPLTTGSAMVVDAVWEGNANTNANFWSIQTNRSWPLTSTGASGIDGEARFDLVALIGLDEIEVSKLTGLPFRTFDLGASILRVHFGAVRFNKSGPAYGFTTTELVEDNGTPNGTPYATRQGLIFQTSGGFRTPLLRLDAPLPNSKPEPSGYYPASGVGGALVSKVPPPMRPTEWANVDEAARMGSEYEVALGNVPLESDPDPTLLPNGVVLDLGYHYVPRTEAPFIPATPAGAGTPLDADEPDLRLSRVHQDNGYWDIMFAPGGAVMGTNAAEPHVVVWLREQQAPVEAKRVGTEAGTNAEVFAKLIPTDRPGNHALVAVNSRSGLIRQVPPFLDADPATSTDPYFDPANTGAATIKPYYKPSTYLRYVSVAGESAGETGL